VGKLKEIELVGIIGRQDQWKWENYGRLMEFDMSLLALLWKSIMLN